MLKIKLIFSLCLLLQLSVLQGQVNKGELAISKTVSAEITSTEQHQYFVMLEADQFVTFNLMQKGVDLKVSTFNPSGEKLGDFDSPNGRNGAELFTLTSSEKGKYIIEVVPFDETEPDGAYELSILRLKSKAVTPNEQVDELFALWDNDESPGAAVAIAKDGAIVYKNGYGLANLEYDIPNSPSTIFHIASISKQFTVFAILLLEKEGKLSIEDDIRSYIPEVPDFGTPITLRHLASHTSGLRDQWNLLAMAGWRLDDVITTEQVLKLVSQQKELNFNPGEEYTYCNTGFTLLAEVVARVSGQSFAEFTNERIFNPLEMDNTLFYDDHEKIVKNRSYSYHLANGGYKKSVLSYATVGATSLFTTVEDLSLWAMNFATLKAGDSTIINKMNTLAVLNNGKTFGGALGQFVGEYKGLFEIQHGGADAGYRSYLTRFPNENISVIVFSNSAEFNPRGVAYQVADIYLKDKIKIETEEPKAESESEDIVVEQKILNTYVGEFELQPGFVITVKEENGQLFAQATGQPTNPLKPLSVTEFSVGGVDAKIEFMPNGGQEIELIKLHQGGRIMDAPRFQAFDKTAIDLTDFAGNFYSEELSTTYHFTVVEGKLIATHNRLSDFSLSLIKEDMFAGDAWFFGQIEFIRDANNSITGFRVSNGRVRNLYFEKVN